MERNGIEQTFFMVGFSGQVIRLKKKFEELKRIVSHSRFHFEFIVEYNHLAKKLGGRKGRDAAAKRNSCCCVKNNRTFSRENDRAIVLLTEIVSLNEGKGLVKC
ncbi:unnamed protein product [Orchesella dallaii]|uniref:Uncharacterized protein n=1 Tax=Orchesella dallaii TaxID=48710 RepID=A0ABP1QRR5_9HEXA